MDGRRCRSKSHIPTAIAGQDITATEGEVVTLDGSNSYAPGGATSVHWQRSAARAIVITGGAALHPKFLRARGAARPNYVWFSKLLRPVAIAPAVGRDRR